MNTFTLTEILKNPHFNQFAAMFSVAMAPGWQMRHPEVPSVRAKLEWFARLFKDSSTPFDQVRFVEEWSKILTALTVADPNLSYSTDDMDWFASVLDGKQANVTFSMLFAVASTPVLWLTLDQVADIAGGGASTWRKKASDGELVGARLAGKTWIIPQLSLKAYGIEIPTTMNIEIDE